MILANNKKLFQSKVLGSLYSIDGLPCPSSPAPSAMIRRGYPKVSGLRAERLGTTEQKPSSYHILGLETRRVRMQMWGDGAFKLSIQRILDL
jgi:hypothetical protein